MSLVNGVMLGALLGALFGAWMLIFTLVAPLAEDTPLALASFYGPMFVIWGVAGFAAYRRTGGLMHAVKVGATVALVTFVVLHMVAMLRVNLFLETISQRSDWAHLAGEATSRKRVARQVGFDHERQARRAKPRG